MEVGEDTRLVHTCENCGVSKTMTPREAFEEGWDYPPLLGAFRVLSPRTCGDCGIQTTLWWRLAVDKANVSTLSKADHAFIERVNAEPESLLPKGTDHAETQPAG